jgi:hypothetical protein
MVEGMRACAVRALVVEKAEMNELNPLWYSLFPSPLFFFPLLFSTSQSFIISFTLRLERRKEKWAEE